MQMIALHFKIHSMNGQQVLACCDRELLGKTISDNEREIVVSEYFYGGEKISEPELAGLLMEAGNANLVGNKCVGVAIKEGLITERSIIKIKGVNHAIIIKL
ncbi:Uncharacterised protein [uncultured archaeon]|nr:Uncharacterised protein [uncultured archaeon]